jgi:hypothetical protein
MMNKTPEEIKAALKATLDGARQRDEENLLPEIASNLAYNGGFRLDTDNMRLTNGDDRHYLRWLVNIASRYVMNARNGWADELHRITNTNDRLSELVRLDGYRVNDLAEFTDPEKERGSVKKQVLSHLQNVQEFVRKETAIITYLNLPKEPETKREQHTNQGMQQREAERMLPEFVQKLSGNGKLRFDTDSINLGQMSDRRQLKILVKVMAWFVQRENLFWLEQIVAMQNENIRLTEIVDESKPLWDVMENADDVDPETLRETISKLYELYN